jgi:hypothetical protein
MAVRNSNEELAMTGLLRAVAVVSFSLLLGVAVALPTESLADADKDHKAALKECKKLAVAKERDECVSNANNRYERGKKEEKATSGDEQGETKGKAKSEAKDKGKSDGKETKGKAAKVKPEDGDGN